MVLVSVMVTHVAYSMRLSEGHVVAQQPKKSFQSRKKAISITAVESGAQLDGNHLVKLRECFVAKRRKSYSEGCGYAVGRTYANLVALLAAKDKEILCLMGEKRKCIDEKEKCEQKLQALDEEARRQELLTWQQEYELEMTNGRLVKENRQLVSCNKKLNEYNERLLKDKKQYEAKK